MKTTDTLSRRLHPKLRMIGNGSEAVNCVRAELSSCVASLLDPKKVRPAAPVAAELRRPQMLLAPGNESALEGKAPAKKRAKLAETGPANKAFVNVIIQVEHARKGSTGKQPAAVNELKAELRQWLRDADEDGLLESCILSERNFISATVPVSKLKKLQDNEHVAFVQPAEAITFRLPKPRRSSERPAAPTPRKVGNANLHHHGEGVLIGIIDVGGFDFAHPDFLDAEGKTRFHSIWDQGGDFRAPPERFGFGAQFTKKHLDAAIVASRKARGLPATTLERQSQQSVGSHGTHVASIAAGRHGVCPKAEIVGVVVSVPRQQDRLAERRTTFSDSTRIIQAVQFLLDVAEKEGKPISINISLGTNGGAHDGSGGVSRWLDAVLATAGRSICVAAGNAGQEAGATPSDIGWIMGRIHSSGQIQARGLDVELEWTVVGNSIVDVSENELEIWYGPQDRIAVQVKPPSGTEWITVRPLEFVQNRRLPSGTILSIYNELYHPTNGCNYAAIYLSPDFENSHGIEAGVWRVRLRGEEIRDGRFHCWIERDDPYELDRLGQVRVFRFPSFFSERSNVDSHSVSSLACGHRVISVANLDTARQLINITSSQGPTRDDRFKPDICAPGTDIVAANGFAEANAPWVAMSGTSMASPYVAGVIGLMLAVNPKMTAAQCLGILQRTSQPLPGISYAWRNDSGFGQIDPGAAILEAKSFHQRTEIK
jgi:subtilisin family serine protease